MRTFPSLTSVLLIFLISITALITLIFLFTHKVPQTADDDGDNLVRSNGTAFCTWNNCPKWSENATVINVHLICHSHDDMGWLKTAEDYYTGARPDIINVGVQYILSTVVAELHKDPARRFAYAEVGFLTRWLEDKSLSEVELLRKLVMETGQLEFVGGGWTQPDEATTHYYELLDQYTLGLDKLAKRYGKCGIPKVAWQIDPFGHSREHANMMSHMGFEALFFSRMHYLELNARAENKSLEMLWSTDGDNGNRTMLTGAFMRGTYTQPEGFCFDPLCSKFDPIIDDPNMANYNLERKLAQFINVVQAELSSQRHNHVLITMGGDFTYSNANMWFANLDRLIKAVNNRTSEIGMHVFYSTPTCYVQAILAEQQKRKQLQQQQQQANNNNDAAAIGTELFERRDGDFFPYASNDHAFWTGYFTSKPTFKGLVRKSSALLQLTRSFDAIAMNSAFNNVSAAKLEQFERALALSTHHDAVTGTSKEAVTQNYEQLLFKGWDRAEELLNIALETLAGKEKRVVDLQRRKICRQLNETICGESTNNEQFAVTVFNGNGQPFNGTIRIPLKRKANTGPSSTTSVKVTNAAGEELKSEVIGIFLSVNMRHNISKLPPPAMQELLFNAVVQPLGFHTFRVDTSQHDAASSPKEFPTSANTPNQIENEYFRLTFNTKTGMAETIEDLMGGADGTKLPFGQQFLYYTGNASGAYLFRPDQKHPIAFKEPVRVEFVKNAFVQEARQLIGPWISQVVRLYPGKPYIEFEFTVGPLPKENQLRFSYEVVTRYTMPSIKSNGVFWTDSNGRQMMKRTRDTNKWHLLVQNEPVSANYYPVNSRIALADDKQQMTVLTDRSQGGTSLADGQLELMVHRRCFQDDGLGVEENLDEPGDDGEGVRVRAKHWLHIGSPVSGAAAAAHRQLALALFHQPTLLFAANRTDNNSKMQKEEFTGLTAPLPPNVNLLTLKRIGHKRLLIRLEHLFQASEHVELSKPVTVNLHTMFNGIGIRSVKELALGANRPLLMSTTADDTDAEEEEAEDDSNGANVVLKPMQIRTFHIELM